MRILFLSDIHGVPSALEAALAAAAKILALPLMACRVAPPPME